MKELQHRAATRQDVENARDRAFVMHEGQFRHDGVTPYIDHCATVAAQFKDKPDLEAIAWLHDVVANTACSCLLLIEDGFPAHVINAVAALTRRETETYQTYLSRLKADPFARAVKTSDIVANLAEQPSASAVKQYMSALEFLQLDFSIPTT